MCGICGFNWDDRALLKKMADIIRHRGPDDHGYYSDEHISLGHRRLSIIDLSPKGRNPMPNEDKTVWITFNGEIYNYLKLKPRLEEKGHTFFSNTDTEVIIHAYEEYGEKCLQYLEGMFAFAIWDSNKKQLFIARDRIGMKPLYYYFKDGQFIFASEIKSILQCEDVERKISKDGLTQLILQSFNVDGQTLFEHIKELRPAHYAIFKKNQLIINRYWDISVNICKENKRYYLDETRKLLFESVKDRMMSDVPVGAALSGGIDCSTIVGILSKLKEEPVKTFTIGFNDPLDEFKEAKWVADHCNTNHAEIVLSYNQVTQKLPKILWHMEMPFARPAIFPNFFLGEVAKKLVTVVYCGEGGDEVFAGYNRYQAFAPKPTFSFRSFINKFNYQTYQEIKKWNQTPRENKIPQISWGIFGNSASHIFNFNNKEKYSTKTLFAPFLKNIPPNDYLNSALLFDIKYEVPGAQTWRVDRTTMASSTEFRFPYLDHRLIESSIKISPIFKFNGLRKKKILQEVAKDFLPRKIVYRRKFPFGIPMIKYFKEDFIHIVEKILDKKTIKKREYLNEYFVQKLVEKIKSMKIQKMDKTKEIKDNELRKLLFLTNLELWQRMFIENNNISKPEMKIDNYL